MTARNCTKDDLEKALRVVNGKYDGNIRFKRLDFPTFTLTVNHSKGKGGRIGHTGRRIAAACWHVHGDFFEALFTINPKAYVWAAGREKMQKISIEGGNWSDRNIGSLARPLYYSEACECGKR